MNKTELRRAILDQQQSMMDSLERVETGVRSDPDASIGDHVNAAVICALHRGHINGLAQALDLVEHLEEGLTFRPREEGVALDLSLVGGFGRGLTLVDVSAEADDASSSDMKSDEDPSVQ